MLPIHNTNNTNTKVSGQRITIVMYIAIDFHSLYLPPLYACRKDLLISAAVIIIPTTYATPIIIDAPPLFCLVPGAGIEPARGFLPDGFYLPLRFSPPTYVVIHIYTHPVGFYAYSRDYYMNCRSWSGLCYRHINLVYLCLDHSYRL